MEVVIVLSSVNHLVVLELEDDAAINLQVSALPVGAVVMNADHRAVITFGHIEQFGFKRPTSVVPIPSELGEDRRATPVITADRASARRVPRGIFIEELGECLHVGGVKGSVTAPDSFSVFIGLVHVEVLFDYGK